MKKSNKNLQASTHLVVNAPEGSKYNAAKKWKLPSVTKQYVFILLSLNVIKRTSCRNFYESSNLQFQQNLIVIWLSEHNSACFV